MAPQPPGIWHGHGLEEQPGHCQEGWSTTGSFCRFLREWEWWKQSGFLLSEAAMGRENRLTQM